MLIEKEYLFIIIVPVVLAFSLEQIMRRRENRFERECFMEEKKFSYTTKAAVLVMGLLLLVNIALGTVIAMQSRKSIRSVIDDSMLGVAKTAGGMLDGDELAALTEADEGGEKQQEIIDKLRVFSENFNFKYIYIVRPQGNGKYIFIVDPDEKEPAAFGEEIVHSAALESAGGGKAMVDQEAVADEWGKYYTAYCPIKTSTGEIGGIVGIDFDARQYEKKMLANTVYIIFVGVFSLLIGGVLILLVTVKLKEKIDRLNEETISIASDIGSLLNEIRDETGYSEEAPEAMHLAKAQTDLSEIIREEDSGVEKLAVEVKTIKTTLKEYIDYVHAKAYIDGMTGVGNKTAYLELVRNINNRIKEDDIRFSIAVFDVNSLKTINDEYGHEEGDNLINGVARCIRKVFGRGNVYRIGGDEFIAVVENCTEDEMGAAFVKLEDRIRSVNAELPEDTKTAVSFAKGSATFKPGEDKAFKEVFRRADKELYIDKERFYGQTHT